MFDHRLLAATWAALLSPALPAQGIVRPPPRNREPIVTSDLPDHATFSSFAPIRIQVTVTDPEGDRVNARWIDRTRRIDFEPIENAPSGTTRELLIYPSHGTDFWARQSDAGRNVVTIESWDSRRPDRKRRTNLEFLVVGGTGSRPIQRLDLHGDDARELVVRAQTTSVNGVTSAGGYVAVGAPAELGGSNLEVPELLHARVPQFHGFFITSEEQAGDVDGDGVDDLVAVHHQRDVLVWRSGRGGGKTRPADALLRPSDSNNGSDRTALLLADVTADGILDIVLGCPWTDTSVVDAGEVLVFAGGSGIVGTPAPTATLRLSAPFAGDRLGLSRDSSLGVRTVPFRVGDIDGDGTVDLLALTPRADDATTADVGAIHVWKGGAALSGAPAPAVLLATTGAAKSSRLGLARHEQAFALVDVTGDGQLDVVAGSTDADPEGAIFVWAGGPALSGTLTETALLQRGTPRAGDRIGVATAGLELVDVTGDGAPDVIAASHLTTTSVAAAGSIEVWAARTGLAGAIASASLEVANPVAGDWLGWEDADAPDTTVLMHDVTGDGIRDVIGVASQATISGRADAGAIYVWAGGAALAAAGALAPTATLHEATTVNGRGFGSPIDNFGGAAVRFLDWNGDGVDDLLSFGSVKQSGGSSYNDGQLLVFAGGASLVGTAPILAKLRSNERNDGFARPFWIAEVTGDGIVDVVASALSHDTPRGADLGSLLVFAGGPASVGTPAATSTLFDAALSGGIGAGSIDSLFECDLDGDGVLELVASWSHADDNERVQVIRRPVAPGLVPLVPISVPLDGYSMFGD